MRFWTSCSLGLLAVGLFAMYGYSQSEKPRHPDHHLHHALWELRDAHKELHESREHFGGHKEKAEHAIHAAIKQIEILLKHSHHAGKGDPKRMHTHEHYKGYKHHPHLHHALVETKHAHHQVKESKHDFGGHREAALHDIHHAITQIEVCLKHHGETKSKIDK